MTIKFVLLSLDKRPSIYYVSNWVGGSRKWPVLLTLSTVFMLIRWVGWVQKDQKYADVIYE